MAKYPDYIPFSFAYMPSHVFGTWKVMQSKIVLPIPSFEFVLILLQELKCLWSQPAATEEILPFLIKWNSFNQFWLDLKYMYTVLKLDL